MNENEPAGDGVVLSNQPVADFSHLTEPEQLTAISRIEGVALVIVPESLAGAYAAIPSSRVAATIYVPDGANVRVHTGALVVGGDGEASAIRPDPFGPGPHHHPQPPRPPAPDAPPGLFHDREQFWALFAPFRSRS
jgi:hypothetical protein